MSKKDEGAKKLKVRHYFVDEAGDATLFGKKNRILVGNEGCSNYFIAGLLKVKDPKSIHVAMASLREQLLSDPTINTIPSMQPERKKTALLFMRKMIAPKCDGKYSKK